MQGRGAFMKCSMKIMLGGMVLLLAAAAAVPWLIPASAWIGRIEAEASAYLGAPVLIAAISVAILPLPHATISGLRVAESTIVVQRMAVYPRLWSLLSDAPALRSIELEQVSVTPRGVELAQAAAAKPRSGAPLNIEHLRASQVQIELAAGKLPAFDADADLNINDGNAAMPLTSARIRTRDGT